MQLNEQETDAHEKKTVCVCVCVCVCIRSGRGSCMLHVFAVSFLHSLRNSDVIVCGVCDTCFCA